MKEDIRIGIGVDSTKVTQGFSRVKKELRDLKQQTKEGFFDLEGEKRVERNLGGLVEGLANARSAADVLAVGMDRLENVFKSSIGASVAVAAIVTLINKYKEAQEAIRATNELIANTRDFVSRGGIANPNADLNAQIEALKKQSAELSGFWTRLFSDNEARAAARQDIRGLVEGLEGLKKQRDEIADQKLWDEEAKALANYAQKEKEYQESLVEFEAKQEKARDDIRKRREASEAESAKAIASFHLDALKDYWRTVEQVATEARAKINAKEKKAADEKRQREIKDAEQQAEKMFAEYEKLQDAKEKRERATEGRNKAYREQIIAEELKLPGQRNEERIAARQAASAEDRAIRRLAQKAQDKQNADWRNARMTNEQKEQMIAQMKAQRAQDKQPQMEKDISEINKSIKKMEAKIGVQ